MERHASWFQLVAVVLVVVGLATLAAPAPAHAMDPQLILALASTAGAIALVVGYLIVANGREKNRAASLEGAYACSGSEANGPMGCGGGSPSPEPVSVAAAPEGPMAPESRAARTEYTAPTLAAACPGSEAAGPMGCGGPIGFESARSVSASPASASTPASAVQGQ